MSVSPAEKVLVSMSPESLLTHYGVFIGQECQLITYIRDNCGEYHSCINMWHSWIKHFAAGSTPSHLEHTLHGCIKALKRRTKPLTSGSTPSQLTQT